MPRGVVYDLKVPTSVAAGTPVPCPDLTSKVVQTVSSSWVGTYDIEGAVRDSSFVPVSGGTGLTGATVLSVPVWYAALRIKVTAYTSGSLSASLGGMDERAC